jgi:hypothetical protein
MFWRVIVAGVAFAAIGNSFLLAAGRFAETNSRSDYVHWIDLYDANNRKIDLAVENAPPYSPRRTCGRCHDYDAIAKGHHFNAVSDNAVAGRKGEPWIWTESASGTQIPLSYRKWPGTYDPAEIGITPWDFVMKFGRHMPGGGPGIAPLATEEPAEDDESGDDENEEEVPSRWHISGNLEIDCMMCHTRHGHTPEAWARQIEDENFAWAATAALGIGQVDGDASRLPDDFDPDNVEPDSRHQLPATKYTPGRVNGDGEVFIDVVRQPANSVCYYCHSTHSVGEEASPAWLHDEDIHIRAGMDCADCHRNDLEHHTVRGFEGEEHPTGASVASLSCRGCHMGDDDSGRLGAPRPLHKGLPALHFEKLSCTACHSGPKPKDAAKRIQTSLAHGLGLPAHYTGAESPGIVEPVFLRVAKNDDDREGKLYPHKMVWPAFWGQMKDDKVTPLNPTLVHETWNDDRDLRKLLRLRKGSSMTEELMDIRLSTDEKVELLGEERAKVDEDERTDEEEQKVEEFIKQKAKESWDEILPAALTMLKTLVTEEGAKPVYVSGGKIHLLDDEGNVTTAENAAAEPYAWPLGHDVRPAQQSLGINGCYECHSEGAPIFEATVTSIDPVLNDAPVTQPMYELAGYDKTKLDAWNQSFQGRTMFKYFGFAAMGLVALIVLAFAVRGLDGLLKLVHRK